MKIDLKYLLLLLCFQGIAQTLERPMSKAHCRMFNGHIYAYGLQVQDKNLKLSIYCIGNKLNILDSTWIDLGRHSVNDFLQLSSDTLHGFFDVHLQEKEKKLVHVFRFTKQFRLLSDIDKVDIARLNSISAFESEIAYHERDVYTVKVSHTDTSGQQFYLNKYSLKSELKNFEYDFKWQFAFEKKNINSAHIVLVNSQYILLYVNVTQGPKWGQWLLRVDPVKGTLIRGTKLNNKGDHSFYAPGSVYHDSITRQIYMTGQKFTEADFSQKDNKLNIINKSFAILYLAAMDSAAELVARDEFKVPVAEPKSNKTPNAYILRTTRLVKTKEEVFLFNTDIYKGSGACYSYCNTLSNTITINGDKPVIDKGIVSTNTLIERFYFSNDKMDMNGKLCADSLKDFEKIYYKTIPLEVKAAFKPGEGSPAWILRKGDTKRGIESYCMLGRVKNAYQLSKPDEISKSENPQVFAVSPAAYIITRQMAEDKFEVKLFEW